MSNPTRGRRARVSTRRPDPFVQQAFGGKSFIDLQRNAMQWRNQLHRSGVTDMGSGTQPLPNPSQIRRYTQTQLAIFLEQAIVVGNTARLANMNALASNRLIPEPQVPAPAILSGAVRVPPRMTPVIGIPNRSGLMSQSGNNLTTQNIITRNVLTGGNAQPHSRAFAKQQRIPNLKSSAGLGMLKVQPTFGSRSIMGVDNLVSAVPVEQVVTNTPPEAGGVGFNVDDNLVVLTTARISELGQGAFHSGSIRDLLVGISERVGPNASFEDVANSIDPAGFDAGFTGRSTLTGDQVNVLIRSTLQALAVGRKLGASNVERKEQLQNPGGSMLPTNPVIDQASKDISDNTSLAPVTATQSRATLGDTLDPVNDTFDPTAGLPTASSSSSSSTEANRGLAVTQENPSARALEKKYDFEPTDRLSSIPGAAENAFSLIYGDGYEDNSYLGNAVAEEASDIAGEFKEQVEGRAKEFRVAGEKAAFDFATTGDTSSAAQMANDVKDQVMGHVRDFASDPRQGVASRAEAIGRDLADRAASRISGRVPRDAPGVFDEMKGILNGALESKERGGYSEGAGGTGNLPAGPVYRNQHGVGHGRAIDHDGSGGLSQAERDHMPFNERQLAYLHQFNPHMAGKLAGPTKIKKKKPRRISSKRTSQQIDIVQQGNAAAAAYRDVFKTSFQ